jgi:osmotically-inducible protein OsmY
MSNETLQRYVLEELRSDPQVDASAIGVAADDGVVTLFGEVPSSMKLAATAAAERVAGVRAVAERMTLKCPGSLRRTDTDLAREAADVLLRAGIPASIKARVDDGELRLEGFADWAFQREKAEAAIAMAQPPLRGLRTITNDVVVSRPMTLPCVLSAR